MNGLNEPNLDPNRPLTFYFLTYDWAGLHEMFEARRWEQLAGVPLVPMYWLALAEQGHRVHVFVCGDFSTNADFTLKGIQIHRRRIPGWALSGIQKRRYMSYFKIAFLLNQWNMTRAVLETAKSDPPDVLYSYHTGCAFAGHMLSRRLSVPHIVHMWGTWLGHYLFKEPWYKRLIMLGSILVLKFPLDLLIISNDGTQGDRVVEKLGFPKDRFRFWLDGTAPDVYRPDMDRGKVKQELGLASTDKMVFQVARLDVWKRIDRAIAAMPTLLARVPNAYLVVAGDGHLRGELEKQAIELRVADHVKFLGQVPNERVRVLHNAADLFLTVQDLTNLGNQLLEAMHSRTCTVAYDVGGTSGVITNGVSGVLLQECDLPRLGEIVADLLCDDELRDRLAQGALEQARRDIWCWDRRIAAEIKEVRQLVMRNDRKRLKLTDNELNPVGNC